MNQFKKLGVLIALPLFLVFIFLIFKTRSIDFDSGNKVASILRDLKQADEEWNVNVLQTKIGLSNNYDAVASALPLIQSLEEQLNSTTELFWQKNLDDQTELQILLEKYRVVMNEKTQMIEKFKSQNSILRNSSRFLPIASADLVTAIRKDGDNSLFHLRAEQVANQLLTDTMIYMVTPEDELEAKIDANISALEQSTDNLSESIRAHVKTVVSHARTIIKQQNLGNALLAKLTLLPTTQTLDNLSDAQATQYTRALGEQQTYARILVTFSGFLLLLLIYAGWQLFRSYANLNKTNTELKKINSDLNESQMQLVQAEKMSALGQMVAGIAHEINTPLAYIKGTFEVLKDQLLPIELLAQHSHQLTLLMRSPVKDKHALTTEFKMLELVVSDLQNNESISEMQSLLNEGIHGIDQISEIVQGLKNFSRLDRAKISDFSVTEGLDSTLLIANNMLKNAVEVIKEYHEIPRIFGSPSQINQVFLNIITNATQAMLKKPEKGMIKISTAREGEQAIRIEIEDNGQGIPPEVLPNIFDPFYTTKDIGQGTGMGLSISYNIIHAHGGQIFCNSELGIGTIFTIILPIEQSQNHDQEALQAA
ncbi:DAHL domain-containing protein [Delftia lacustris]|uniref:DAHL domain-containing protein n=1 Tax=Delftia lacustris TaxID=558537 RepID=UPI0035A73817